MRTSDSRALDDKELTERQRVAIKELREILARMASDGAAFGESDGLPWMVPDEREARAILLNGRRGSGKTSLMLTLAKPPPEVARFLPFVDLDPVPEGLPMIGWLIQAFHPLCGWLDGGREMPCPPSDRARGSAAHAKGFVERLREVQRIATLAWDWSARTRDNRGQVDWTLDAQNQLRDWAGLQDRWRIFIGEVCAAWDAKEGQLPSGRRLLVVTLDDPDLYQAQASDLLLSIRLLWHPRVVFLLAGLERQLLEELTLDLARRQTRGLDSMEGVRGWLGSPRWESEPRLIASAILEKVLPRQNRVDLGQTGLFGLLKASADDQPSLEASLNKVWLPGLPTDGLAAEMPSLGHLLGGLADRLPGAFRDDDMNMRTWAQLRRSLARLVERDDRPAGGPEDEERRRGDRLVDALHQLLGVLDADQVDVTLLNRGKAGTGLLIRSNGPTAAPGYAQADVIMEYAQAEAGDRSLRKSRIDRLVRQDGNGLGPTPHPFLLVSAEASTLSPGRVRWEGAPPLAFGAWTWFVHVHMRALGREFDLPWPWIPPRSIAELLWWIRRVRELELTTPGEGYDWERVLAIWSLLNLDFASAGPKSDPVARLAKGPPGLLWSGLLHRILRHGDSRVRDWVVRGLLTMAAPEGGLPENVASRILWLHQELRANQGSTWPRMADLDVGPRLSRLRAALGGAGRPQLDEPRVELAEDVFRALAMDPAHPWNVVLSVAENPVTWWILLPTDGSGKGLRVMELLGKRSFLGVSVADPTPGVHTLLDLLWCNPVGSQATQAWSEFLRPGPEQASDRLRGFLELISSFQAWEEGAAALALARMYDWLLRELGAPDALRSWVRPDAAGTSLELDRTLVFEFALRRNKEPLQLGALRIFDTDLEWAWSVGGLPKELADASKGAARVFEATLGIIQSFVARREGAVGWGVKLLPLLEVAADHGKTEAFPAPPLLSWSDAEALRLAMAGVYRYVALHRQRDPAQPLVRWLVLVWADTCWNLLYGRGIGLLPGGRPRQPYPVEELERLERAATHVAEFGQDQRPLELRRWAQETLRLAPKVLDADAAAAWRRGAERHGPAATSPTLTALNSGSAGIIVQAGLPGIGREKAKSIAAHVRKNGPFHALDDLIAVPGIGKHNIALLKSHDAALIKGGGGA